MLWVSNNSTIQEIVWLFVVLFSSSTIHTMLLLFCQDLLCTHLFVCNLVSHSCCGCSGLTFVELCLCYVEPSIMTVLFIPLRIIYFSLPLRIGSISVCVVWLLVISVRIDSNTLVWFSLIGSKPLSFAFLFYLVFKYVIGPCPCTFITFRVPCDVK